MSIVAYFSLKHFLEYLIVISNIDHNKLLSFTTGKALTDEYSLKYEIGMYKTISDKFFSIEDLLKWQS